MDDRIEIGARALCAGYDDECDWEYVRSIPGHPMYHAALRRAGVVIAALDAARPAPSAVEADWASSFLADIALDPEGERTITSGQADALLRALSAAREASAGQSAPDLDLAVAKASEQYWMEQALEQDENISKWRDQFRATCEDNQRKLDKLIASLMPEAREASAGQRAPDENALFHAIVDAAWNAATESEAVPSTDWADRIIAKARAAIDKARAALNAGAGKEG